MAITVRQDLPKPAALTILFALAVAAGAVLIALAWLATRRRPADGELAAALAEVSARVDRLAGEVGDALQAARAERRRGQALGDLAGSIDLDEVLTRTLEAATRSQGVQAALLTVRGSGDEPVVATLGIEADRPPSVAPPDGSHPRAVRLSYLHERAGAYLRSALAIPLPSEGEELGYLVAYARDEQALGAATLAELEQLAERAGPAIDNARRFREARRLADLDALTGLHNRRYFHETLAREVARANRYQRELALIVLDLDDFKAINDRIGHLAGDAVLAEAAERLRDVVRSADVACRVGGDEFAIVLPESTPEDAKGLYRRLQAAMAKRPLGQAGRLALSAGVAELRPEDDAVRFFERADEALYRAKAAGKGTLSVADAADLPPPATFPRSAPGTAGSS
jgi:diguanylate cyclase (GGDEF)-like protein